MSTVSKPRSPRRPKPEPDPYRYGWRYVRVVAPDGSELLDQVPLTLEDVLFPEVGDFIVQTRHHNQDVKYLADVFEARLAGDPSAVVVSDYRVDWNLPGVRPLGPDIAVFVGVKRDLDWDTFDVAAEGAEPVVVVEVTSPRTRANDLNKKVRYYRRARVPFYLIADATGRGSRRRLTLIGRRYTARGFQRVKPDAQGRIYLERLRLSVGVTRDRRGGADRLACFDAKSGEELGNYTAVVEALGAAEARARAANEQARAANQQARAEAQARAAAEARASAALARIRELESELKQTRGRG
jgi:Uma2 family endonuclease